MHNPPAIQFSNLRFGYGDGDLINDLSLSITSGKLTALCGPNGSGKSTLLKLATHLLRPRAGTITVGGADVAQIKRIALARQVASLPQTPSAPAEISVSDLVMLGRFSHRRGFAAPTQQDHAQVAKAITQTDLTGLAQQPIGTLSGGQRQRAWVAMALAQDAPILLLDEPTNHLDISHALEIMTLLRKLTVDQNKTVICVVHDINLAAGFADDIVFLREGAVVAQGAHHTVMTQPLIEGVFGVRCQIIPTGEDNRVGYLPRLSA
jgi:iron complex transport system ATP-binding protein